MYMDTPYIIAPFPHLVPGILNIVRKQKRGCPTSAFLCAVPKKKFFQRANKGKLGYLLPTNVTESAATHISATIN